MLPSVGLICRGRELSRPSCRILQSARNVKSGGLASRAQPPESCGLFRLPRSRTKDQHGTWRVAHSLLGDTADYELTASAPVSRHDDQIDRLLLGVVAELLNRRADHGKGKDLV